ncbi:MAG: hypothetical protein ACRDK0_06315, partial [Solirubrobacteraceae bacterium]
RLATAALALATALAGCGGGGDSADEVLRATADGIGKIHSADLGVRLVLGPLGGERGGRVGFDLRGPVDLERGELPAARLRYTQIAGDREGGATFISTGREAFVEVAGTAYRLPAEQSSSLAARAGAVKRNVRLPVGRWMREPEVDDGGQVGGVETDHVSAKLDAVAALRDIFAAARSAGAEVPNLAGARGEELRRAIDAASVDIWSGQEDRLLRRMRLRIGFRVAPPAALRQRLGELAGGSLALDVDLAALNEPVRVQAPSDPRPAEELAGAGSP